MQDMVISDVPGVRLWLVFYATTRLGHSLRVLVQVQ